MGHQKKGINIVYITLSYHELLLNFTDLAFKDINKNVMREDTMFDS